MIGVGHEANRSDHLWVVSGQSVYVLQQKGSPWTVKAALKILSAFGRLSLSLGLIPRDVGDQNLTEEVRLGRPLGESLGRILKQYGLVIQRDLTREGGQLVERRSVRLVSAGRSIRLSWGQDIGSAGGVLRVDSERKIHDAKMWVVRAKGWLVESTFHLVKGWDPALEAAGWHLQQG